MVLSGSRQLVSWYTLRRQVAAAGGETDDQVLVAARGKTSWAEASRVVLGVLVRVPGPPSKVAPVPEPT